jgi:hypothetical protein
MILLLQKYKFESLIDNLQFQHETQERQGLVTPSTMCTKVLNQNSGLGVY